MRQIRNPNTSSFEATDPAGVHTATVRLRGRAGRIAIDSCAEAIARACGSLCSRTMPIGRETIAGIAERRGWSQELVEFSLQHLCAPFTDPAHIRRFAETLARRKETIGMILPGNIPGGGLHEVVAALLSGAAVLLKTATDEPLFFESFARIIRDINSEAGARIEVLNWTREQTTLTRAMIDGCDRIVVFGDDGTLAHVRSGILARAGAAGRKANGTFSGFGSRVSGGAFWRGAISEIDLREIAKDAVLFEQRGCLSPHHLFIEDPLGSQACRVAEQIASEMELLRRQFPAPSRLPLEDAVAIRGVRESARWRAIGGRRVKLWEGADFSWTVIYDREAGFCISPGYRTIYVSPFSGLADLERRLEPIKGRLEAFSVSAPVDQSEAIRFMLRRLGATWICRPGQMQSPALDWEHGGGQFIKMLRSGA